MKKALPLASIAIICSVLSSCELVGGIFKAGMWTGVIAIVVVVALVIWVLAKIFGGK
ncbi:putative small secreted protein [Pedobacter sp. UYEF25]